MQTNKDSLYDNIKLDKKTFKNLEDGEKIQILQPNYKVTGKVKEFNKIPYYLKNALYGTYDEQSKNNLKIDSLSIPGGYNEQEPLGIVTAYQLTHNYIFNEDDQQYLKIVNE